ncbi:MAG: hypothetical protein JNK67_02750 [Alphaproteobacteria bacterium]|nr:hypothetical protein [Alphaproteobacteria bacterium]
MVDEPQNPPRIRDLIEVAGKLIVVLREETAALRSFALTRVAEITSEKTKLVESYVAIAQRFKKDPETLDAITDAVRAELTETLHAFDAAARENESAIVAAREANERVLRAIVDAVEAQRPKAQGYGRTGMAVAGGRRGGPALSVAIDRQF